MLGYTIRVQAYEIHRIGEWSEILVSSMSLQLFWCLTMFLQWIRVAMYDRTSTVESSRNVHAFEWRVFVHKI